MKLEVIQYKKKETFYKQAFNTLTTYKDGVFACGSFKDGDFIIKQYYGNDTYYLLYNGKLGIRNARSIAEHIYSFLPCGQGVFTCDMLYKALKTLLDNMWREDVRSCNYFHIKVK